MEHLTAPPIFTHAGTQAGDVLRLEGGGIATVAKGGTVAWGSHFFVVQVIVPNGSGMSETERSILEELSFMIREGSRTMERWW